MDGYSDEEILAAGGVPQGPRTPPPPPPPTTPWGTPVTMAATPTPSPAPPPLARRPPQQFQPGEPGWWQASDGYWYPPESRVLPPPPAWAPTTITNTAPGSPNVVVNVMPGAYGYAAPSPPGWGPQVGYYAPPKSKVAAGLLGIFLGALGAHRFYMGHTGIGVTMLLLTVLSLGLLSPITALWGFIEGIVILCGGMRDNRGQPLT